LFENEPHVVSAAYDPALSRQYGLHLNIAGNQVSYGVTTEHHEWLTLRSVSMKPFAAGGREEWLQLIAVDDVLRGTYAHTTATLRTTAFALTPEPVAAKNIPVLLHAITASPEHDACFSRKLDTQGAWIAWGVPRDLFDLLQARFGQVAFHHSAEVLAAAAASAPGRQSIYAHLAGDAVELMAVRNRQVALYNIYNFAAAEDFLYYTARVYEQAGLDMHADELVMLGDIEWKSNLIELLRRYVRHVKLGDAPHGLTFDGRFSNIAPHRHFVLFGSALLTPVAA
jgi:hypothetical protein